MLYIVYGAGALGGLLGARLAEAGEDVVLIARGAHAEVIARRGLAVASADGVRTVDVPVVTEPGQIGLRSGDLVLLTMKSQDTAGALDALRRVAPGDTPVVCVQNGVDNERAALRLFPSVYSVCVMCPATHLEPGLVLQHSVPVPGMLDIGRYPCGTDATVAGVAAAFRAAGFESIERPDVMRWKYRKLLMNLGNAPQALFPDGGELSRRARKEGEACLQAAGIDYASSQEDRDRRGDTLQIREIEGHPYAGGSSWQSLRRATGSIESDYLNGEISLLGRLHGVPTPINDLLLRLAWEAAAGGRPPGALTIEEFEARLTSPTA